MVLLAAVLYFAAALPLRREAAETADAFGRARVLRHDAAARVAAVERRREARARAVAAVTEAVGDPATRTRAVRRSVSQVLERSRAAGVSLAIRPGAQGVDVTISARGSADDVVRLAGELARPDVGVVLGRVQLNRSSPGVNVVVEGLGVARP
jgi:hypothetical protein